MFTIIFFFRHYSSLNPVGDVWAI